MTGILLPQQCSALKHRALTQVGDFTFHTLSTGGHEKYGAFQKGVDDADAGWDQTKQQKQILDHDFSLMEISEEVLYIYLK